jgi:PTS system nitrogen regulatory IIA component
MMNQVASSLSTERILIDLTASGKAQLFADAGRLFAAQGGLDPAQVAASLMAREKLGSTGLGQGVAIPHARVKGLRQAHAAFIRLRPAIAFDAPDGKPVSEVLILLVPEQATEMHLQMLSEAAQMFSDRGFRDHLRDQRDVAGVWRAFADWPRIAA